MIISRRKLHEMFAEYNQQYFGGRLTRPNIYFLMSGRTPGRYVCGSHDGSKASEIWVSKRIDNEDLLKTTIIHEMAHQYAFEVLKGSKYRLLKHGLRFHLIRLYLKYKFNIMI